MVETRVEPTTSASPTTWWRALAVVEIALAVAAVWWDLLLPSVLIALLACASLAVRRQGFGTLGLHRPHSPHLAWKMLAVAAAWSLVQLGVTMPLANHLSGRRQDLSGFADLEGNLSMLALFLVLAWTLAAFVEELAFRGFLLTRLREVLGPSRIAIGAAIVLSSLLFGVMHSEQGVIGVLLVSLDAIVLCLVRLHYDTLWASVLVHGFNNTLGFVAFFLVGPIYGFW